MPRAHVLSYIQQHCLRALNNEKRESILARIRILPTFPDALLHAIESECCDRVEAELHAAAAAAAVAVESVAVPVAAKNGKEE